MATKPKVLYKFLRTDLKSDNGQNRDWTLGKWRKEDNISICNSGFHASKTPLQALGYVSGEILAEVEVKGDKIIEETKECWSEMRIVKAYHWRKEDSVALAIFAAEKVISIFEKKYPNDKRPREAIEAAKNYLKAVESGDKNAARAAYAAACAAHAAARAAHAAAYAADAAAYAADAARAAHAAAYAAYAAADARKKLIKEINSWFVKRIKKLKVWTK